MSVLGGTRTLGSRLRAGVLDPKMRYDRFMKAIMVASFATLLLTNCNAAKAEGPQILSQLSSKQDNLLISQIQSRNPGTLCSLTPADGHARLMSYGSEAVVDINAVPILLSYHPDMDGRGAKFTAKAIEISGKFRREPVTDLARTVSQHVSVQIETRSRSEHLEASWTCQAALITVQSAH